MEQFQRSLPQRGAIDGDETNLVWSLEKAEQRGRISEGQSLEHACIEVGAKQASKVKS